MREGVAMPKKSMLNGISLHHFFYLGTLWLWLQVDYDFVELCDWEMVFILLSICQETHDKAVQFGCHFICD